MARKNKQTNITSNIQEHFWLTTEHFIVDDNGALGVTCLPYAWMKTELFFRYRSEIYLFIKIFIPIFRFQFLFFNLFPLTSSSVLVWVRCRELELRQRTIGELIFDPQFTSASLRPLIFVCLFVSRRYKVRLLWCSLTAHFCDLAFVSEHILLPRSQNNISGITFVLGWVVPVNVFLVVCLWDCRTPRPHTIRCRAWPIKLVVLWINIFAEGRCCSNWSIHTKASQNEHFPNWFNKVFYTS